MAIQGRDILLLVAINIVGDICQELGEEADFKELVDCEELESRDPSRLEACGERSIRQGASSDLLNRSKLRGVGVGEAIVCGDLKRNGRDAGDCRGDGQDGRKKHFSKILAERMLWIRRNGKDGENVSRTERERVGLLRFDYGILMQCERGMMRSHEDTCDAVLIHRPTLGMLSSDKQPTVRLPIKSTIPSESFTAASQSLIRTSVS